LFALEGSGFRWEASSLALRTKDPYIHHNFTYSLPRFLAILNSFRLVVHGGWGLNFISLLFGYQQRSINISTNWLRRLKGNFGQKWFILGDIGIYKRMLHHPTIFIICIRKVHARTQTLILSEWTLKLHGDMQWCSWGGGGVCWVIVIVFPLSTGELTFYLEI